jgi:hypothetical protein
MSEQDVFEFDDVTVEELAEVTGGLTCSGTVGSASSISTPVSSIASASTVYCN